MQLPAQLLRRRKQAYKNQFGHILILSGSRNMVGASALCGLAAMRSGAGLVTLGVPSSLNAVVQKKISPVLMTLPLKETAQQSISFNAYQQLKLKMKSFTHLIIGPGLSLNKDTIRFILKVIENRNQPVIIDADALNALSKNLKPLSKTQNAKILTPHPGEMARLTGLKKSVIENNRKSIALDFAKEYNCVLLLKGHQTVVASPKGDVFINSTGNPGMATAGSGDVLSGIIAAFWAQGLTAFQAAQYGAYVHGKAGDIAAKKHSQIAMIATDIIDNIPKAIKGK